MRSFASLLLAAALGCGNPGPGGGTGRPPAAEVVRPTPSSLRITEVYVADADTNAHFVELKVDDEQTVELVDADLCGPVGCIPAKDCSETSVQADDRVLCDLGELDLPSGAGELAVVVDDVVLAYLAWGTDPAVLGSPWSARAVLSGVTEPGAFVPLPFPMPNRVAMINEPAGAADAADAIGCAAPSPGDIGTLDASLCDDAVAPTLFITEILAPSDEIASSWVELQNTGDDAIRLAGARLCQLPSCAAFGYRHTIGARGYLLVHLGREGATADSAQLFFPDAEPVRAAGELVLLAPGGNDVAAESGSLLSFVRYGTSLPGGVTVDEELWPDRYAAARAPRVAGESLARDLSGLLGAGAWNPAEPTPVALNPDIGPDDPDDPDDVELWQSCSFPRPWNDADPSDVVVTRVAREDPVLIRVRNRGDVPTDLSSYELALAAATFTFDLPIGVGGSPGGVDTEAVARVSDTDVDADDFVRAAATPGSGSVSSCTGVVISEVVTRPYRDWNDSSEEDGVKYDSTPGTGAVNNADEWIELHNCGDAPVDVSRFQLELWDGTPNVIEIGTTEEVVLAPESSSIPADGYLVLGNPDAIAGLDDIVAIRLLRSDGVLIDEVLIFSGEVAPGASITVELDPNASGGCSHPLHLCWLGAPVMPGNGEITLFDVDQDKIVQHIAWGSAARVYTSDAVADGVWPLTKCALPALEEGGVFELSDLETGHSPPDYH
jgi:hypothetical protein